MGGAGGSCWLTLVPACAVQMVFYSVIRLCQSRVLLFEGPVPRNVWRPLKLAKNSSIFKKKRIIWESIQTKTWKSYENNKHFARSGENLAIFKENRKKI